jgi:alkanesulfonate monooxygenase SsuD/methylene tetrahydromethanopterin reductase-like flavin-dependent oxidoreductase (luciferase family)
MVFCADTGADAQRLARPLDVMLSTAHVEGREIPMPTPEAAAAHEFTAKAQEFVDGFRAGQVLGDQRTVARSLNELAARFDADELMLTTAIYDPKERIRSFELVATAPR